MTEDSLEFFAAIFDLFEIPCRKQPDLRGNPFWLSSAKEADVHWHVRFTWNGVKSSYLDHRVGRDSRYCRCT